MKYMINTLLWIALGILLVKSGITVNTWQYWGIFACVFCMNVNTLLW